MKNKKAIIKSSTEGYSRSSKLIISETDSESPKKFVKAPDYLSNLETGKIDESHYKSKDIVRKKIVLKI